MQPGARTGRRRLPRPTRHEGCVAWHWEFAVVITDLRVPSTVLTEPDDAELAWAVIEPAFRHVNVADGAEAFAETMAPLTPGQRALLALHWCVAEVSNGGFDQFFNNPTGLLAAAAVEGFRRIGAAEAADLVTAALDIFAERPPAPDSDDSAFDEHEGDVAFGAYRARHEPLEERFYVLVDTELYPRAAAYVREHPGEFVW